MSEGVTAVTDEAVELCVTGQARDGEAVSSVLAEILGLPKTNAVIIKGFKSRDKTVSISGIDPSGYEDGRVATIKEPLLTSIK
jgi:uncharacterized protein YggU (UPF0235/DUF167 family)